MRDLEKLGFTDKNRNWSWVDHEIGEVVVAADPVCNTERRSVSELGDASTRKELDDICSAVGLIKADGHTHDLGGLAGCN
jgi:hypothetical protein